MPRFGNPLRSSVLLPALRAAGRLTFVTRPLKPKEIERLEAQGCSCEDWDRVQVEHGFRAANVREVRFREEIRLGRFFGFVELDGAREPAGLLRTTLENVWIEDGVVIRDTTLVSNMRIGEGAAIVGCGRVVHTPGSNFGVGSQISFVETGGRVMRSFPEMTLRDAENAARPGGDTPGLAAYLRKVEAYAARAASGFGVVQDHAALLHTPRIENAFVGSHARIDGAQRVSETILLSEADAPAVIEDGAVVKDSVVQWGCEVTSLSIVENSVLCEASSVERHGKAIQSIIGPNTTIAEGEVTSSLVGPFVGFHHQALLIGVVWPEGKGNVAYGCNCGSNHTGRAPDQEFWPGEGMFLGLGVNVKYPGRFTEAPYTMVATGTTLLPQSVSYPFSLIMEPLKIPAGIPAGYNEIHPGWLLSRNLFAILRNERKFRDRDRSTRNKCEYRIFRSDIARLVERARTDLEKIAPRTFYTDRQLPGLGKNFMSEETRQSALESYTFYLHLYSLQGLFERIKKLGRLSPTLLSRKSSDRQWEFIRKILTREKLCEDPRNGLLRYVEILEKTARDIESSKARDDERGKRIIPDYEDHHILAHEHPFIRAYCAEVEAIADEVYDILDANPNLQS